jgi:hypothetical protein
VWNNVPSEQQRLLVAVAGVALASAYLFSTLLGLGTDYQAAQQERFSELARVRHSVVCTTLGRSPTAAGHDACVDALVELQGWHRRVFLEESESPL